MVDAVSGKVLFRRSTIDNEHGDTFTYDNYPGAAKGGTARKVNLIKRGWLSKSATFLNGKNVVAWADVNDDNAIQNSDYIDAFRVLSIQQDRLPKTPASLKNESMALA